MFYMITQDVVEMIENKYDGIKSELDERALRKWAATEARAIGHGGILATSKATGLSPHTIRKGIDELSLRGRPLTSHEVIVNLIANTTTREGLKINAELDTGEYPTGIKITDTEMKSLNIERDKYHGEWNYIIRHR